MFLGLKLFVYVSACVSSDGKIRSSCLMAGYATWLQRLCAGWAQESTRTAFPSLMLLMFMLLGRRWFLSPYAYCSYLNQFTHISYGRVLWLMIDHRTLAILQDNPSFHWVILIIFPYIWTVCPRHVCLSHYKVCHKLVFLSGSCEMEHKEIVSHTRWVIASLMPFLTFKNEKWHLKGVNYD